MSDKLLNSIEVGKLYKKHFNSTKQLSVPADFNKDNLPTLDGDVVAEYRHFAEQHLQQYQSTSYRLTGPKTGLERKSERQTKLVWNQRDRKIVTGDEKSNKHTKKGTFLGWLTTTLAEIFL